MILDVKCAFWHLKSTMSRDGVQEVRYLNRMVRRKEGGLNWVCEAKHLAKVKADYGMQICGTAPTPITKESVQKIREVQELNPERSRSVR